MWIVVGQKIVNLDNILNITKFGAGITLAYPVPSHRNPGSLGGSDTTSEYIEFDSASQADEAFNTLLSHLTPLRLIGV